MSFFQKYVKKHPGKVLPAPSDLTGDNASLFSEILEALKGDTWENGLLESDSHTLLSYKTSTYPKADLTLVKNVLDAHLLKTYGPYFKVTSNKSGAKELIKLGVKDKIPQPSGLPSHIIEW